MADPLSLPRDVVRGLQSRFSRGLVLLAFVLASAGVQVGNQATAAPSPSTPPGSAPAAVAAERSAVSKARARGKPVEVSALTTETRRVVANPSGTLTMEQHLRPVRVRRGGHWVPVDTALRRRHADGTVAPEAAAVDLAFSAGGDGPLATLERDGRSLSLSWPRTLPAPELDGATATYPDVLPGVDLTLRADVEGFSQVLVVKDQEAANNPALAELRLGLSTRGLSVRADEDGALEAVDDRGAVVFRAPPSVMWDSSGRAGSAGIRLTGPVAGDRRAPVGIRATDEELVLSPDTGLLTDPATRFPVYIDPWWRGTRLAWAMVDRAYPNQEYWKTSHRLEAGTYGSGLKRTFFRMNTKYIRGKRILKATFRIKEIYSWSCQKRGVQLWLTGPISSSTNWNNQPRWTRRLDTVHAAKGRSGCPAGNIEFGATSAVRDAARKRWATTHFGLRAANESDVYGWKGFSKYPKLVINYNTVPNRPTNLGIDPNHTCRKDPAKAVFIATTRPRLRATATDPDGSKGQHVGIQFRWGRRDGSNWINLGHHKTSRQPSGTSHTYRLPGGDLVDGGFYRFWARAYDGNHASAWSGPCHFGVDTTPPAGEPGVASTEYPEEQWGGGVGKTGAFTFSPAAGDTDVVGYVYSVNQDPPSRHVRAPSMGASVTVRTTPDRDGPNVLRVRSKDRAGNLGPIREYVFKVLSPSGPVAHWKLDEGSGTIATDSTGNGHTTTLTGGASWTGGRLDSGLRVDANGEHASMAGPVVRTDQSYTVTAWARLESGEAAATVVSQAGAVNSGFQIYYSARRSDDGVWVFNRHGDDTVDQVADYVKDDRPATLNVWTHLAGVFDAATDQMRFYVNGRLVGSAPSRSPPWHAGESLDIGRAIYKGTFSAYFAGAIDDVRVYDRVLFGPEIVNLANPPTLVGHWTADEGSGTTAADSTGNGHTATLSGGASWTQGRDGTALAFDGTAGRAATGGPVVRTDQSFTVAAWVRPTTLDTTYVAVSQNGTRDSGFKLGYVTGPNQWGFWTSTVDSDTPTYRRALASVPAQAGVWTHLAGVYDAAAGELRVYVDGLHAGTVAHSGAWHAGGDFVIGESLFQGSPSGPWAGAIDDVRAYRGVLSEDEIYLLAVQ